MAQRRNIDIPASRHAATSARREVAGTLEAWGLGSMRADAELVVSELMSNAVRHARADASHQLHIVRRAETVRLVVPDGSSVAPAIRHVEDGQIGGRGLRIIEAITSSWGYDPHPLGKHVWAELKSGQPDGNPRSPASDAEDSVRYGLRLGR